jgi:hypothetical protein
VLWVGADPEVLAILEAAGLGDLVDRFVAEDIDGSMLWSLQEDDLRELGLTPAQRQALLARLIQAGAAANSASPDGDEKVAATKAIAAAEQALQRSDLTEASRVLDQAELALARMDDAAADPLRLRVLIARSSISRARQGISSEEAGRLGRQVLDLAHKLRETRSELMALTGLYTHALVRAEYFVAGKWAELLSERAAQAQDSTFRMIGRRGTGVVALHVGSLTQAMAALQEALDSYDEARHLELAYAHGYDHAEICSGFLSFARWISGDPVGGQSASDFAVAHSRRIAHMHSLAQALVFRAMLMSLAHDWDESLAAAREAEAVGRQYDLAVMYTASHFFSVAARLSASPAPPDVAGLKALRQSFAEFKRVNPCNYQQVCGLLLVSLQLRAGDVAEAEAALLQAEDMQARTRETFLQPELLRMRARLLRARGDDAGAQHALATALQDATRKGATMFALRIACDMAEAAPSAEALARLLSVRGRLVSDDGGVDARRCEALLAGAP